MSPGAITRPMMGLCTARCSAPERRRRMPLVRLAPLGWWRGLANQNGPRGSGGRHVPASLGCCGRWSSRGFMGLSKDLYRESSASVGWGDQYLLALYFFVSYGDTSMSLQGLVVRVSRRCDGQLHSFVVRLICPVTYVTRSMIRVM